MGAIADQPTVLWSLNLEDCLKRVRVVSSGWMRMDASEMRGVSRHGGGQRDKIWQQKLLTVPRGTASNPRRVHHNLILNPLYQASVTLPCRRRADGYS